MDTTSTRTRTVRLLVALTAPLIVGAIGGIATSSSLSNWYPALQKPDWTPPGWLFAPVWTALYLGMGYASWRIWMKGLQYRPVRTAWILYLVQLTLNLAWTLLFFGLQRPDLALIDIFLLDTVLAVTLIAFLRLDRLAGLILSPYLLWSWFATALNASIWWMNRA